MATRRCSRSLSSAELACETALGIHAALERVVALGAELAVVRARSGEVLGAVGRSGWEWRRDVEDGTVIVHALGDVDLGVFTRGTMDTDQLGEVAQDVARLIADRWVHFAA